MTYQLSHASISRRLLQCAVFQNISSPDQRHAHDQSYSQLPSAFGSEFSITAAVKNTG